MAASIAELLQILQFVAYFVVATIFIVMIKADNKIIRVQIDGITENIKVLNTSFGKIGDLLTKIAVQETRLSGLEQDIRELKHGEGFVRGTTGIDREYNK